MKIWSFWQGLEAPAGMEFLPTNGELPTPDQYANIEFYVPKYMAGKPSYEPILHMPNLKVVQLMMAGFEEALPYMREGITLCNARGVHDASTAELAVGMAIGARRGYPQFAEDKAQGIWNHKRNPTLVDSKVAIVGFGSIGLEIAAMLKPFHTEVVGFSRSGTNGSKTMIDFDSLLPTFDVVILITPLTPETKHLMNAHRLGLMKDGATLINVARGPVVDTDALVAELNSGRISAGLDVTDPEPLPQGHPLWNCPNVIIAPHVGGDSNAFVPRGRKLVVDQLGRISRGEALINIVS